MDNSPQHSVEDVAEVVRRAYDERDVRLPHSDWRRNIYHPRHELGRLFHAHNRDALIDALNACDLDVASIGVLDVGCGFGYWLRHFVELGARPANLTGIDLSPERIAVARETNPAVAWIEAQGTRLPFNDAAFDLVLQVLVFSSVPDEQARRFLAAEMYRVAKPGGYILWLDLEATRSRELATFSEPAVLAYFASTTPVYAKRVHPYYFRKLYRRWPGLALIVSRLTSAGCESRLLVLRKDLPLVV